MVSVLVVTLMHKPNLLALRSLYEMDTSGVQVDYFQPGAGYPDDGDGGRTNIVAKHNEARSVVLGQGYDYMLSVEDDMVIPPDALHRLLAVCEGGADVAYGLYVFRRPPFSWSATLALDPEQMVGYPLSSHKPTMVRDWGRVVDVDGVGFGCTLIARRVLEHLRFRVDWSRPHPGGEWSHDDWYFALDCVAAGFVQRCDLGCVCGHIHPTSEEGRFSPGVIMPVLPGEEGGRHFVMVPFPEATGQ
jgi:hypothetical protein